MITPIGVVTLALCLALLFVPVRYSIICFTCSLLLGAAAAFVLGGSGNIQPSHVLLVPLAIQIARGRYFPQDLAQVSQFPRPAFWLFTFVAYGVICSMLMPRLFSGVTEIYSIGSTKYGPPSTVPVPLTPTSGNINQAVYLTSDLACFLLIYSFCGTRDNLIFLARTVILFAGLNAMFAALDFLTSITGTAFLLDPIRNAEYDLHLEENVGGLRRIVGSFTETSLFSFHTVGAFAYNFSLWLSGRWPRVSFTCAIISLALLLLSTSGTAYAAVAPVLAVFYFFCMYMAARGECTRNAALFLVVGPILSIAILLYVLMNDSIRNTLNDFISATVLSKSLSESGIERAKWNALGMRNFYETYFLGSGLGSTRTSSWVIAVLASTGIPGAIAMCSFFWTIAVDRARGENVVNDIRRAARFACFSYIVGGALSFSLVDLRLPFFVLAAMACAKPVER